MKNKSERARGREEQRENKKKHWRSRLLNHDSSVEVGYGLCYFIVNS